MTHFLFHFSFLHKIMDVINNPRLAIIVVVVITASPGTTRTVGTYIILKGPNRIISGPYSNPVILTVLLRFVFSLIVIVFILNIK